MFKSPPGLSMPTSFADTRTMCKQVCIPLPGSCVRSVLTRLSYMPVLCPRVLQSHKWLLVNIQDHDNFRSHSLNRDVWGDETIQCLIQVCTQDLSCGSRVNSHYVEPWVDNRQYSPHPVSR